MKPHIHSPKPPKRPYRSALKRIVPDLDLDVVVFLQKVGTHTISEYGKSRQWW